MAISKPSPSRENIAAIAKFFSLSCSSSENNSDSYPRSKNSIRCLSPCRNGSHGRTPLVALRSLQTRFRLAIISNIDDDLFATTEPKLGVKFDQIITAQQAGAYKPSLKIFELALSRIGVPAHRVLHVGQSIYHDVIPAQSLGLATVWVNRPSARSGVGAVKAVEGHPDLQVSSLVELAAACAQR